jgi:hypothetical protein
LFSIRRVSRSFGRERSVTTSGSSVRFANAPAQLIRVRTPKVARSCHSGRSAEAELFT